MIGVNMIAKRIIGNAILIIMSVSILPLVHGCAGGKTENKKSIVESKPIKFKDMKSKNINGVIVPKEYFQGKYPNSGNYWTITDFDFENLENRLEKYLREEADIGKYTNLPDKFRKYNRQYVGKIVEGKKVIFINFFCRHFEYWKWDWVSIEDGGDCFFSIEYDIKTKKFSELWINGEA
jgi:hypothetical protein